VVPAFRQVCQVLMSFSPSNLKTFFPKCRLTYRMLTGRRNFAVPRVRTTFKGLITVGFSSGGNNVTALAANISTTTDETNPCCSYAEGALCISLRTGATSVHNSWYPCSIHSITTELRTNVRQNSLQS
jgi:hypothetical protein